MNILKSKFEFRARLINGLSFPWSNPSQHIVNIVIR